MANNYKKLWTGVTVVPKTATASSLLGELETLSADSKLYFHNGTSNSPVVTEAHSATLTNKTIAAGSNTITGLADTNIASGAAISATKIAAGVVDNTEFGYLDGVTSSIQTQLNAKQSTSLTSAHILVGNGSNVATDVAVSGDVTITNTGNIQIASGVIVDADINASAAIDASKIANGTVSSTEFQFLSNVTSDIQTQFSGKQNNLVNSAGLAAALSDETGNGLAVFNNQPTITNASIQTPSRSDVKQDTFANLTTYASTAANGQLVFATDTKAMYQVLDAALVSVGSSAGGADTFVMLDASEVISAWSTGNNATFLGGGTLAGTFAKDTTTPLNGSASYKYTQASGSLNDYVASAVQSVPLRFRGNQSAELFTYTYNGGSSDIEPVVWDVTNSAKLNTTTNLLPSTGTNTSIYKAIIAIPASCTQVRIGFQTKIANSGKVLAFDDVQMSSDTTRYTDVSTVTSWQSYTPTFTGFGTVTNNSFFWRQVGESIQIQGSMNAGTVAASLASFSLPNSYVLKTSVISVANTTANPGMSVGSYAMNGSVDEGFLVTATGTSTSLIYFGGPQSSTTILVPANGSAIQVTGGAVSFNAMIPIAGLLASNPQIITPADSFSSDTASLVYASSATYTLATLNTAPVGTFITFTYASSTNTRTQTTTAPTQTTSDMNVNGINIFTRAFNAASTSGSPSIIAIQVGQNFKGIGLTGYKSTGKATTLSLDYATTQSTVEYGAAFKEYNESTGVLLIDVGYNQNNTTTARRFTASDGSDATAAYITINASKSPALVGVPQVQPRFATLSEVQSAGTGGGTSIANTWTTRTLNTIIDSTGIVTSLSSSQFTLQAGTYQIDFSGPTVQSVAGASGHRIRNITDSTTALSGQAYQGTGSADVFSGNSGEIIITSSKVFALQYFVNNATTTAGLGQNGSITPEPNTFGRVRIQKIK